MGDFAWIPVHQAPEKWEGENVLWRNGPDQSPGIRTLPKGFSRVRAHTGTIEVAGPVGDVFNNLATIATLTAALEEARGAVEWIVNPSTGMSHVIFRQEATFKAERALATINAALGRVEG